MNYHVSDIVIRIKNASLAKRRIVVLPNTKMTKEISKILVREGFLAGVKEDVVDGRNVLTVTLSYYKRTPVFTDAAIISKPSLRVHTRAKSIRAKKTKTFGTSVVSTSQGIMTEKEAAEKGIGGEVLFRIW